MEGMDDPFKPGHMSVTFKQEVKDGTWIVLHGTPAAIRKQIEEVFDLKTEADASAPLYDLINEATRLYKSTGTLSGALGGRVVSTGGGNTAPSGSAWERNGNGTATEQAPPADLNVLRLTKAIEAQTDVSGLHELYARDSAHFGEGTELLALWQAKGKSLSA